VGLVTWLAEPKQDRGGLRLEEEGELQEVEAFRKVVEEVVVVGPPWEEEEVEAQIQAKEAVVLQTAPPLGEHGDPLAASGQCEGVRRQQLQEQQG
jgi:hypothetical protein